MKEMATANRSRRAKRLGLAVAIALTGTLVSGSATHARSPQKAKSGGEINVAIDGQLAGFCFSTALAGGTLGASRTIYESLVERSSNGKFVPYLAESFTPSADNKVWDIALRSGIKYSNGEAFDATNVKQNIELGRGNMYAAGFNAKYASTGVGVNANIVTIDVIDPLKVRVTLDRGDNEFLGLMYRAGRYVMRAPAQIADPNTCQTNPIGTGPFMKQSYSPDELVVVRNPNYWRKDAAGVQLPYLDKITFINVKEASQRAAAVRKQTVDVGFFVTGDATFIKDLQKRKSVVTEYRSPQNQWGQWMPNVNKAGSPFKYQNCRLAAAFSVDWVLYNKVRFKGLGLVNGSIVGKENPLYTKNGAPSYDLAKAKEFVGKCNTDLGAAAPFKVTLYADTSSQSQNNVKFVQGMMEKAGIQFNSLYIAEAAVLISKIYKGGGNDFDFAEGTPAEGVSIGYVIPFFLSKAFSATSKSPVAPTPYGKGYNTVIALGNHSDTTVDDKIYAAQAEPNPVLAKTKYAEASAYLMSQGYTIPTIHVGMFVFTNNKSKLKGVGKLLNPDGKTYPGVAETKGFDYTGIYKG
ncbi:MAG: ABC transporter substrate-binding protein [Ilumatobacteraceae bacterium]